jgi:hypothetical protein
MSVKPGSVATHIPPSLPSFAQTFSSNSLSSYGPDDNSLPPIQSRVPPNDFSRVKHSPVPILSRRRTDEEPARAAAGRKRTHAEASSSRNEDSQPNSGRNSPSLTQVKEEPDTPPLPTSVSENKIYDTSRTPAPSSISHPPKKRRVTISGAPALNTDVRVAPDQTNSTPISPVVIGLPIHRDNPSEVEQIRSMISVKQQQQALIEQRRGSTASLMSPTVASGPSGEGQTKGSPAGSRSVRRSPNAGAGNRRHTVVSQTTVHRPLSPNPTQPAQIPPTSTPIPSHSLPPPPISFARRRANQIGGTKRKPADIMISPRDAHTPEQFAPSIQSAPPIPHAGHQGSGIPGRFPMALPRLPSVMGTGDNVRRTVGGNVPPTPTRFSVQRIPASQGVSQPIPGISGRSPPTPSVAIASTLVPPTPSILTTSAYTDKAAFMAPFETLYATLNDSTQLKVWLGEQLQRSKVLMQTLTQQQDKLHEVVDSLVEKKVAGMRTEISGLHRRVEELEDALRVATSSRRPSLDGASSSKSKGKQPVRNGIPSGASVAEGYTFPPIPAIDRERLRSSESERRISPAGWSGPDKDHAQDSDTGSPAPFESRRLSLSSSRLELPRAQSIDNVARPFAMPSPPMPLRDGSSILHASTPSSKFSRGGRPPAPSRQQSSPRLSASAQDVQVTSSPKRDESRRNSIIEVDMDNRES